MTIYCGKYGCDDGVVWMMNEFPVPCEDCRKLREAAKAQNSVLTAPEPAVPNSQESR